VFVLLFVFSAMAGSSEWRKTKEGYKKFGIRAAEEDYRRNKCFLALMLQCVAFGMTVVALNSVRWSVFESPCDGANSTLTCAGKIGFYHYELSITDNITEIAEEGRINSAAETALCNVMTYNEDRDWVNEARDDCDRYLDAADNGSTLGIAAGIIGAAGVIWAAAASISETEEDSSLDRCFLCPRLLTAAPIMSFVAGICSFLSAIGYSNARPADPDYFLQQAFANATFDHTNGTMANSTVANLSGNTSHATNASSASAASLLPTASNSSSNGTFLPPSIDFAVDWELGLGLYMMIVGGFVYLCACFVLVMARRYNQSSQMADAVLSVPLMGPPQTHVSEVHQVRSYDSEVLEVWEADVAVDAEERHRTNSIPNVASPNADASDSLKTSLLDSNQSYL